MRPASTFSLAVIHSTAMLSRHGECGLLFQSLFCFQYSEPFDVVDFIQVNEFKDFECTLFFVQMRGCTEWPYLHSAVMKVLTHSLTYSLYMQFYDNNNK